MKRVLIAGLLSSAFLAAPAAAKQADGEKPELAGYTRTGQMSTCIYARQIEQVKILNGKQILFEMTNGRYFLNEPEHCPTLRKRYALKWDATTGQVCNTTIVTLLEPSAGLHHQGACGLAKFERVEKNVAAR